MRRELLRGARFRRWVPRRKTACRGFAGAVLLLLMSALLPLMLPLLRHPSSHKLPLLKGCGGPPAAVTAHIVFCTKWLYQGSTAMRALAIASGINAMAVNGTKRLAAAKAFVVEIAHDGLQAHIASHGQPTVCVLVKNIYNNREVQRACRAAGALILWDVIDQELAWNLWYLRAVDQDAIISLTAKQQRWLEAHGLRSVLIPHGHSNLGGWSVAGRPRPQMRGVGFVYAEVKSLPGPQDLRMLNDGICRRGATLYLVKTATDSNRTSGLFIEPMKCRSPWRLAPPCAPTRVCRRRGGSQQPPSPPALPGPDVPPIADLESVVNQKRHYESNELIQKIDVGLSWRPSRAHEHPWAVANRDGTRMAWWFSHRLPVIAYPMHAHVELAASIGYPMSLVNVTDAASLDRALCLVAPQSERSCLMAAVRQGNKRSSPQGAAHVWLAAMQKAHAARCSRPTLSGPAATREYRLDSWRSTSWVLPVLEKLTTFAWWLRDGRRRAGGGGASSGTAYERVEPPSSWLDDALLG